MTRQRIMLVIGDVEPGVDAIHDYAQRLAAALTGDGAEATVISSKNRGVVAAVREWGPDAVVVQYNPFSFGRRGVAPGLLAGLLELRVRCPSVVVGVMCHETVGWLPGWLWRGVRQLHRTQLAAVLALSRVAWASTDEWLREVRRLGGRAASVLPVGSNLPDERAQRARVRRALGADTDRLLVASFSTGHLSHQDALLKASVRRLAGSHELQLLTLGAGRTPLALDGVDEICPGLLEPAAVARLLAAADLYICPYVDGVSTRRGTVMAALQHGVPVLGTVGISTAAGLRSFLGPYGVPTASSPGEFAERVGTLVGDREELRRHGERGRLLYSANYDWPVIANRLISELDVAGA